MSQPRKSVSSRRRSAVEKSESTTPTPAPKDPSKVASSSKMTLDMPPLDVPDSITWDFTPPEHRPVQELSEDDKDRLIHELLNFAPFNVLHDIAEHARSLIYPTVTSVEQWAQMMSSGRPEFEREAEAGSYALETLLEQQVDKAFDKFTAYALRNIFSVPDGVELVMPWHKGIDFTRAQHVVDNGGEEVLQGRLDDLRAKIEQARYTRHRLIMAEAVLDKKLRMAEMRRKEVGFVNDLIVEAGLHPLNEHTRSIASSLSSLHSQLASLDPADVPVPTTGSETDAWEAGRQAYLRWALGRAMAEHGDRGADELAQIEKEVKEVGDVADLEAQVRR
ncbi:hypothetical protein A1Q1_01463 [Trichosporon asahii var. asahii CBS 2479]|uniref:Uncharacterized protein n=1 Tax=Trichosporon asahii var. asahii (strain ATCC 90039 / CBS 2479 / JCM 2466 / KCTC 7840 / NBRC 103889/ NCYC 2677 / UAMH 7654) TaxID=1186058 RepID=J5T6K1_TRIAS|nr:hypothetical protein A1Q1_01463 [Trichosporon asahii var. asahii CBS 2479]EJT49441.1 hypothetical protein A1Q1_01463 [Trichosporon asahii var. asahii CBS 2479]